MILVRKQQLAPMIYQQIFQMNHFKIVIRVSAVLEGDTIDQAGNQARKVFCF